MEIQPGDDSVFSNQDIPFLYENFVIEVDELISLAHYGPGLILVIGAQGMGKTSILEQFESELSDAGIIRIDGSPLLNVDQLFASILQQLQVLDRSIEFDNTRQAIIEASEDIDQVILVDDASQMPPVVLESLIRLVSPLSATPEYPVRLMLAGEDELLNQISEFSLVPSNAIFPLHLGGLEPSEIAGFLGHQLNLSQVDIEANYGKKQLSRLWKTSEGNPGKILKSLHHSDEVGILQRPSGSSNWIKTALIITGVLLLLLAIFGNDWWFTGKSVENENSHGEIALEIEPPNQMPAKVIKKAAKVKKVQEIDHVNQVAGTNPKQPVETLPPPARDEESGQDGLQQIPSENNKIEPAVANNEKKINSLAPSVKTLPEIIEPELINRIEKTHKLSPHKNPKLPPILNNKTAPEVNTQKVPAKTVSVSSEEAATNNNHTPDENWILQQSSGKYMLQYMGSGDEAALKGLLEKYSFPRPVKIYRSQLNQKPWFILVAGLYDNADSARNQRTKLSVALQKLQPWVKSVKVIQKQLQQASNSH